MRKYFLVLLMICSLSLVAQDKVKVEKEDYSNKHVEMADAMRTEGKIYVVVAVLVVMFTGLLAYAIRIDQKLGRLEKELEGSSQDSKTIA